MLALDTVDLLDCGRGRAAGALLAVWRLVLDVRDVLRGGGRAGLELLHLGVGEVVVREVHVYGGHADEECTDDVAQV